VIDWLIHLFGRRRFLNFLIAIESPLPHVFPLTSFYDAYELSFVAFIVRSRLSHANTRKCSTIFEVIALEQKSVFVFSRAANFMSV
jgi:hypothetical protein